MEQNRLIVVREDPEPCRVKLSIEVPAEEVDLALQRTGETFCRKCRLPGFRPGKSPKALVQRRFAKEIELETRSELIQATAERAIRQEGLQPETRVRVENEDQLRVQPGQNLVFAVAFDVAPTFTLPDYRAMQVTTAKGDVNDDDVERAISDWLQGRASFERVDRPAQAGDMLKVSYHGRLAAEEAGTALTESAKILLDAEDTWLALREPEILPGCAAALVGTTVNSEHSVRVTFPQTYFEPSLVGRTAEYLIRVLEVHGASVPELTDALAKQTGVEDAGTMREAFRRRLEADQVRRQAEATRNQLLRQLLERADFALPPSLVAGETYSIFLRLLQEEAQRTPREEELREKQKALLEQSRVAARERLRRYYVLSRVAEKEAISVTAEEVDSFIALMGLYQRLPAKTLRRRLEKAGRLGDVYTQVLERKTLDHLVRLATGGEEPAPAQP